MAAAMAAKRKAKRNADFILMFAALNRWNVVYSSIVYIMIVEVQLGNLI